MGLKCVYPLQADEFDPARDPHVFVTDVVCATEDEDTDADVEEFDDDE